MIVARNSSSLADSIAWHSGIRVSQLRKSSCITSVDRFTPELLQALASRRSIGVGREAIRPCIEAARSCVIDARGVALAFVLVSRCGTGGRP